MRTRQKSVATDTWRSLGCRTTPLEYWSRRKPTVEPRWAKQQTKKLRPKELSSWLSALAVLVLKCISDLVSRAGYEIRLYRFLIVNTCCLVILRSMDLFAIGEARRAVQDRHMTPESRFRSFKCNGSSS